MLKQALLVFLLFSLYVNSQNENLDYDLVTKKFINHYNNQQYDSIYFMFSSLMKKDVTKAGVRNYLSELRRFEGEIKEWEFEENRKPNTGVFSACTKWCIPTVAWCAPGLLLHFHESRH